MGPDVKETFRAFLHLGLTAYGGLATALIPLKVNLLWVAAAAACLSLLIY